MKKYPSIKKNEQYKYRKKNSGWYGTIHNQYSYQ